MNPKFFAAGVLVAGVLAAAGGGAYLAVRQNAQVDAVQPVAAAPAPGATRPVTETEAVVGTPKDSKTPAEAVPATPEQPATAARATSASARTAEAPIRPDPRHKSAPAPRPAARPTPASSASASTAVVPPPAPASERPAIERETVAAPPPAMNPAAEPAKPVEPPPPPVPQFDEVVIPASAVIGLQVETPLSTERSKVEDRVDARVTRDVSAGGHVAIPQGSRVIGSVTFVDKGGKVKTPARLGVRFHTLVLADGREIPLRTEPFFRDGESPAGESTRKIGGAAVGGAILGAIMGGGKGAAIGGAAGAAGGTAAVMAGDRNAAVLAAGTIVTVRLASPVTVEVEKRN